jgi:hypothetical protein
MTVEIPLTKGYVALVDDWRAPEVFQFKWHVVVCKGTVIPRRALPRLGGRRDFEHLIRFLFPHRGDLQAYTRDFNPTNLQESNIYFSLPSDRMRAIREKNKGYPARRRSGCSGFRGVVRSKERYVVVVHHNGGQHQYGVFDTALEAAEHHDTIVEIIFGAKAILNFPPKPHGVNATQGCPF